MAAVAAAAPPISTRPVLLREWSYNAPSSETPVANAVVVNDDGIVDADGTTEDLSQQDSPTTRTSVAAQNDSPAEETAEPAEVPDHTHPNQDEPQQDQEDQLQYPVAAPVATFVSNWAINLRSSIDHIYAGIAERIDENNAAGAAAVVATAQKEENSIPPQPQQPPARRQDLLLLEAPPSAGCCGNPEEALSTPIPLSPTHSCQDDSLRSWEDIDAFDEAEFVIVDSSLVAMPTPPPTAEEMDDIELSLRGRGGPDGKNCGGRGVRRGVGRLRKWMKRRAAQRNRKSAAVADFDGIAPQQPPGKNDAAAVGDDLSFLESLPHGALNLALSDAEQKQAAKKKKKEIKKAKKEAKRAGRKKRARSWSKSDQQKDQNGYSERSTASFSVESSIRSADTCSTDASTRSALSAAESAKIAALGSTSTLPIAASACLIAQRYEDAGRHMAEAAVASAAAATIGSANFCNTRYYAALACRMAAENEKIAKAAARQKMQVQLEDKRKEEDQEKAVATDATITREEEIPKKTTERATSLSPDDNAVPVDVLLKEISDVLEADDDLGHKDCEDQGKDADMACSAKHSPLLRQVKHEDVSKESVSDPGACVVAPVETAPGVVERTGSPSLSPIFQSAHVTSVARTKVLHAKESADPPSPSLVEEEVLMTRESTFSPPPRVALSDAMTRTDVGDAEIYNDTLKVVFVGAPGVGKSSLVRRLKESFAGGNVGECPKAKRRRGRGNSLARRSVVGADVHTFSSTLEDKDNGIASSSCNGARAVTANGKRRLEGGGVVAGGDLGRSVKVKFSVWDLEGCGHVCGGAHHMSQSIYFSSNTLYVIVWDMAARNSKAGRRDRLALHDTCEHHDSDDDEEDEFLLEEHNRSADRALERDVDDKVLSWVEFIQGKAGAGSAILPVASFDDTFDGTEEGQRRCDMMRDRLLRYKHREKDSSLSGALPDIILDDGLVPRTGATEMSGVDGLRRVIIGVAARRLGLSHHQNEVGVSSKIPSLAVPVLKSVQTLKRERKVAHIDEILANVRGGLNSSSSVSAIDRVHEALRFLSSIGEVLYFGDSIGSLSTGVSTSLLSQYVIFSRKWLVSAMSCIFRHDLKREVAETRRFMNVQLMYSGKGDSKDDDSTVSFLSDHSNCPHLSSKDCRMLWQSMNFMRVAADNAQPSDATCSTSLFDYLELLFVRSGMFVPLSLPRSVLDEKGLVAQPSTDGQANRMQSYLLPSLFAAEEPTDIWTYKSNDSWKSTLCHTWLFPAALPQGLIEKMIVSVVRELQRVTHAQQEQFPPQLHRTQTYPLEQTSKRDLRHKHEDHTFGSMRVHEFMCWREAFLLKVGVLFLDSDGGELRESTVEMYVCLADRHSHQCVASGSMANGTKKVILSCKGQDGNQGRKMWKGGYGLVLNSIDRVMGEYDNMGVEKEVACPDCLARRHPSVANVWARDDVRASSERGHGRMRCRKGHLADTHLLCGVTNPEPAVTPEKGDAPVCKPISSLLGSVVVVGLWDGKTKQIRNVGTGFVVDRKQGLIITASHILFNMGEGRSFGQRYYGLKHGKVVIGVIPWSHEECKTFGTTAVFRYFADIVAHDIRNVDACVLRITTRLEQDVGGEGEGCGDQPEIPLMNNAQALRDEKLQSLKLTRKFELEENIRILGYNQGGEGLLEPGKHVNRCADFAKGYVCKKFKALPDENVDMRSDAGIRSLEQMKLMARSFTPREEIVVMCPTISGHSGGPCVNHDGNVIGILSRADPADKQRCYLVPATELRALVRKAKARCAFSPMNVHQM